MSATAAAGTRPVGENSRVVSIGVHPDDVSSEGTRTGPGAISAVKVPSGLAITFVVMVVSAATITGSPDSLASWLAAADGLTGPDSASFRPPC